MSLKRMMVAASCLTLAAGCTPTEVRSKWKGGPEFRHKGSDSTDSVRWTAETGVGVEWENEQGHHYTSGLTYRRRDVDEGDGDNDNGVWVEFSFPLWRAPKKPERDIADHERRILLLEELVRQMSLKEEAKVEDQP